MEYAGPDRQGPIRRWHRTHVVANRRVDTAEGTGFLEAPSKLISNGRMTLQS